MDARETISCSPPVAIVAAPATRLTLLAVLLTAPAITLAAAGQDVPAAATFAAPNDGMPLVRVLFALLLVLAAVFAAAKLSRRMGVSAGTASQRLEIIAQTALGPRERAVLLRIGERQVLLGVATGNVRLLVDLQDSRSVDASTASAMPPAQQVSSASVGTPSFRALLLRSLGR